MVVGMMLAGGVGHRIGAAIPKQFIEIKGKKIIQYPLETMENHPLIDVIEIVCIEEYIDTMWDIVQKNGYKKVKWVVAGGDTCQDSIKCGLDSLKGKIDRNDIVLMHMASYPLAPAILIDRCIESTKKYGNGCTARPIVYSIYYTEDRITTSKQIDRDKFMMTTIPIAYNFGECMDVYDLAYREKKGIYGNVYPTTLYCDYGKTIYFTEDSDVNLKVTNPEDIQLMEAYLNVLNDKSQ